jgi:hypothetical protein
MWKETAIAQFKTLKRNLLAENKENQELSQN